MEKMSVIKIGILGGALNPVTNGHIALAQYVLKCQTVQQIWLTPCYGHMFGKEMATSEQRLEMCKLAAKVDMRIKSCDYEIKNKLKGETYLFLKQLLAENFVKDQYDFSYIIGSDNANRFNRWVNYKDLERKIRFIVVNRQGINRDEKVNWYLKPPHIYLIPDKSDIPEVSSTMVKQCMASRNVNQVKLMLDPDVYRYILDHKLYM